ncbi:hypothetical protein [Vibrio mediterranei]|uniref:hypothetical protein n=1 Tax=Vibrio mediterranei TaxID=689 RepID=UPI00148C3918|nr:hypothetical protein [Vibrio mediterranei]NOH31648.1 hypothetical protein [Vibrio mediterranei]
MKDNARLMRDDVAEKAKLVRRDILRVCNDDPRISTLLDDFSVFVDDSINDTYEYVATPVRNHVSKVEQLVENNDKSN